MFFCYKKKELRLIVSAEGRRVRNIFLGTVFVAFAQMAWAQAWPEKPLRLIHGGGVGGNGDIISRLVAQQLGENLGQSVVVESRPGAGQAIALSAVAKSPPDGYTLVLVNAGLTVSTALNPKLPYNLMEDFSFISMVSSFPFVVAVAADSPFMNMNQLVEAARRAPGKLSYATPGVGTTQNLIGELINSSTKVDIVHAAYTSATGPMIDLLGGRINVIVDSLTATSTQIKAGKIRVLGVTSAARWPGMPETPTLSEVIPGFEAMSWTGIAAPVNTPSPVVERLNQELRSIVATEAFKKRLEALGSVAVSSTRAELRNYIGGEVAKWKDVAKSAQLQLR